MNKTIRIFSTATCVWAVFMLILFIFLSLCVEMRWMFINNLPAALDWLLRNVLVVLFKAGRIGVPVLSVGTVALTAAQCIKDKGTKSVDIAFIGTSVIFAITASIIAAIDTSVITQFS